MTMLMMIRAYLYLYLTHLIRDSHLKELDWPDFVYEHNYTTCWFRYSKESVRLPNYEHIKQHVLPHFKNRPSVYIEDIVEEDYIMVKLHCCY